MTLSPASTDPAVDEEFPFEFVKGGVDPRTLKIHKNVRLDPRIKEDREFLDSIRRRGVRTPIAAYRDAAGDLHVLRGQRRTLGAVLVGRQRVQVVVEPEPTEAERIADQVVENDQRAGLVAAEHAAAFEEMTLLGLSADDIAAMAATPLPKVAAGLAVAKSEKAVAAVAAFPNIDLFKAAAFAEFAEVPDALSQLERAAKHGTNWDHTVQTLRDTAKLKAAREAKEAELKEAGYRVLVGLDYVPFYDPKIRPVERIWDDELVKTGKNKGSKRKLTVAKHKAGCKGHAVYADSKYLGRGEDGLQNYDFEVVHVCADVGKYKHDLVEGVTGSSKVKLDDMDPDKAARERAERRKVKANNASMRSATTLRLQFVASLLDRKKLPAGAGKMMAAAVFRDRDKTRFAIERGSRVAHRLFGLPPQDYRTHEDFAALSDDVSDLRGELISLVLLLSGYEDNMGDDSWRIKDGGRHRYLKFLQSCGYELSPVEQMAAGLREVANVETLQEALA